MRQPLRPFLSWWRFAALPCLLLLLAVAGCGSDSAAADPTDGAIGTPRDLRVSVRDLTGAPPEDLAMQSQGDLASPCGVCPQGYSCGSANGIPVCRAPSGVPLFSHVFVVLMENTSWSTLDKSNNTPYLHGLKAKWAYSNDYHGVTHPSLGNYIALTSGGFGKIECDCDPLGSACNLLNCGLLVHLCGCPQSVRHIGDDLDAAGLSWRAYGESMGAPCNTNSSGAFAARHVPFVYYPSLQSDAKRCASHVVDYAELGKDLAATPRIFNFISPNQTNNMHDPIISGAQNLANGDTWLSAEIPHILDSPAWSDKGLLVIVWDEDDLSGVLAKDDPIPIYVISRLAKQNGYAGAGRADHYSLLATFEDGLGLPRLGDAKAAQPLADYFPQK